MLASGGQEPSSASFRDEARALPCGSEVQNPACRKPIGAPPPQLTFAANGPGRLGLGRAVDHFPWCVVDQDVDPAERRNGGIGQRWTSSRRVMSATIGST